ncbi:mediator complex subunit MED14-domain-containing protein [Choanephora cucurbitarum]|nr:mediator complex subunit MED14-domain-containing protein [Choanephora cucurbitarum]
MHPTMTTSNGTSHLDEPSKDKEKIVLPVEMASMVPLRTLIAKLVHKSYADLLTLTDTLPSMSDVEKKRRILTYSISVRKQFLKLLVLIKWAENAEDIQMCQNIMAFLANQNKIFQDTVDYLHNIHSKLPAARLRNFDIPTAVDVLTTGTYQRMPTKIKDMMAPVPLSDQEVLETFQNMNDVIRMRMITTEVLPSPMQTYRIENGRIYFTIQNEFEVALTLMGHSHDRRWWIVSLDMLVQATATGGAAEDVDITLNETQKQHLRVNAQKQLVPPPSMESNSLFFPLVNMYDYLHLCCLNMQLEVLYIQAAMLAKTRWINQLKVQMNPDRTKLTLVYWRGGSLASRWASRSNSDKSTTIEISVNDQEDPEEDYQMAVRDDWYGVIQKAGIGASIHLSELPVQDRFRVLSLLKYPKTSLSIVWDGHELKDHGLDPSDLNLERLVLQTTHDHGACMIDKFRSLLLSQRTFLEENGLFLDTTSTSQLVVRYRHAKYISIDTDTRTGRIKAFEADDGCHEGDFKLRGLEDRLNNDPENIARHLLWLRSEVVVREVIALAKQLNLQPYHPSQMNLRPEDIQKLFGDLVPDGVKEVSYPSHCVFLQFSQFEDWYFCMATVKNQFKSWLCCIK